MGAERYGFALLLILASMIFIMATHDGKWSNVISLNLQAFALFASTRAAQPRMAIRVTVGVIIGLVLVAAWIQAGFTSSVNDDFVRLSTFSLVVIATPAIAWGLVRQVKARGMITTHTMLGVLCIYLLMSLAFSAAFGAISAVSGDPFFQQGAADGTTNNYLYYSLTTITTVGMGDFTPATNLGRSLTAAEALIGQIYVITVVAVIVGNLGRPRNNG
ncbi:MAG TPA: potassium channel family protein [Solirubrobacterales bacterium]|jgi:cytochrome bd-type quinol oxidase subunit 2|nr:potassium channel family protein [Solirubrobacterales bacterium]HNA24501.1 potassium channel family protein [Solirubrobacterales bacterium]HNA44393.1 potassium channel family protein [Solirubrobacterales bacterium]HNC14407.1 potassium channel family protein [Solirubrobacterales bacterium]HNC92361.1 potassium channel family protein [Solirubrobacterales bacterium]